MPVRMHILGAAAKEVKVSCYDFRSLSLNLAADPYQRLYPVNPSVSGTWSFGLGNLRWPDGSNVAHITCVPLATEASMS